MLVWSFFEWCWLLIVVPELHEAEHTFPVSTRLTEAPDHFSTTKKEKKREEKEHRRMHTHTQITSKAHIKMLSN